jgi:uncharacterized Ntn-hydrolase superfamily protein
MPLAWGRTLFALSLCMTTRLAHATYSIVAADTRTHRTGGAGTSCLEGQDVYIIHGAVPKVGTLHVQSLFNARALTQGTQDLAAGLGADAIVARLTAPAFDADYSERQFGIATVNGETATFTGANDGAFAGDRRGTSGTLVYAVQGNLLTSRAVIDQAADAFESTGCDLPERLMRALEAGARHGEGDRRCTGTRGIPSDSAFLRVAAGDGDPEPYVELRVPTSGDADPLVELRAALEAWRKGHPCDEGTAGASGQDEAGSAGAAGGCGCDLPRGRTPEKLALGVGALAALGLAFRRRRDRPEAL